MAVGQCPFLHRTTKENDVIRNPEVLLGVVEPLLFHVGHGATFLNMLDTPERVELMGVKGILSKKDIAMIINKGPQTRGLCLIQSHRAR